MRFTQFALVGTRPARRKRAISPVIDPASSKFDEFEVALATTPAPQPSPDPVAQLLEALRGAGAVFPDLGAAALAIERTLDDAGDLRAAETLSIVFARLPNGRHGTELRLALLQGADVSAREARRLGISRQVLHRSVARLRARILQNG